ncbi:MAG: hypothetical protein RLZZ450_7256 [Pseudomonadota bacterium]|jgi:Fe2+ transport system protein B
MKRAVITIALLTLPSVPLLCALAQPAHAEETVTSVAAKQAQRTLGKRVDDTTEAVGESVDSAKERAGEAAERAKERSLEAAESLTERARDVAESAKELASELVVGAREQAHQLAEGAAGVGAQSKTAAGDLLQLVRDETRKALIGMAAALDNRAQESRSGTRQASWEKLKARFSLQGDRPTMVLSEELRDHEYRVARLKRAKELAEGAGDKSATSRSERMLEAEYARHKRRLDQMRKEQHAEAKR